MRGVDSINGFEMNRRLVGLTQSEAAKRLGVAQCTVSIWERGAAYPRARLLPRVAALYRCTIDELICNDVGRMEVKHAHDNPAGG